MMPARVHRAQGRIRSPDFFTQPAAAPADKYTRTVSDPPGGEMTRSVAWPVRGARAVSRWAANLCARRDVWLQWVRGIAAVAVFFQPASWLFFQAARPERVTFIDKKLHKQPRLYVDPDMVAIGELFLTVSLCTSILGLLVYAAMRERGGTRAGWVLGCTAVAAIAGLMISRLS
jgi:hypothetical protein